MSEINKIEVPVKSVVVPDCPNVMERQKVTMYVPIGSTNTNGINSYDSTLFNINNGRVSIKNATNTNKGVVQGDISSTSKTIRVNIEDGYIVNIQMNVNTNTTNNNISQAYTNLDTLYENLRKAIADLFTGNAIANKANKATNDKNGNDIVNTYQTKNDNALETTAKKVVDAINELYNGKINSTLVNTDILKDIQIVVNGDNINLRKTFINLVSQTQTIRDISIPLADEDNAGLMSNADYKQLRKNTEDIETLKGIPVRLEYTGGVINPEPQDIYNWMSAQEYSKEQWPFIAVGYNEGNITYTFRYYSNTSWTKLIETAPIFTNDTAGIIRGSNTDGKVFAENDGTGSVKGWDSLKNRVTNIEQDELNDVEYDNLIENLPAYDKQISNPNLLINGDFRVNQRGFTEINCPDAQSAYLGYTVDRWRLATTSTRFGKLKVNSNGGLDFTCYSGGVNLSQFIDDKESAKLKGKTFTASIKVSNISGDSPLQLWIRNRSSWVSYGIINITTTGVHSVTATIPSNATGNFCVYIGYDTFVNQTTASIDWVKLELGSVATAYSPRPYAEEFAMCQRYYQKFVTSSNYGTFSYCYTANNTNQVRFELDLPVKMRDSSTIKLNGNMQVVGSLGSFTVVGLGNTLSLGNRKILIATIAETLTSWSNYFIQANNDRSANIELDAEIY